MPRGFNKTQISEATKGLAMATTKDIFKECWMAVMGLQKIQTGYPQDRVLTAQIADLSAKRIEEDCTTITACARQVRYLGAEKKARYIAGHAKTLRMWKEHILTGAGNRPHGEVNEQDTETEKLPRL